MLNKNWKENTMKLEDNTLEITLTTVAKAAYRTHIKATVTCANEKIMNAMITARKMNIYKVIAFLSEYCRVMNCMDMANMSGTKGITLPVSIELKTYKMDFFNNCTATNHVKCTSKVIGTDALEVVCNATEYHKDEIDVMSVSNITVETKLPKYAYQWTKEIEEEDLTIKTEQKEETEAQEEQEVPEQKEETAEPQEEQNVSCETSPEKKGIKTMKQIEIHKIIATTTHDGNHIKINCINLFKVNGQATALFEIVGKEHLKFSVTISNLPAKKYPDILKYLTENWKQVIKIIRNPYLIRFTKLDMIKVKLYNEEKDTNDFEIRLRRNEVEFKDDRYFINSWESCTIKDEYLYNYIFYSRARVMKKAHKMIKEYKKHNINIPLSFAIKYYAKAEKVYMGTAKNEEEATKELEKEMYQPLNKEEKRIHYSIPYSCYKGQNFEKAVNLYGKYMDIVEKEYNKETKCMDFEIRIKKVLMKYDNFIFANTYDKIMMCERVIYRPHLEKLEEEMEESEIKNILNKTLIIEDYQTIIDVLND